MRLLYSMVIGIVIFAVIRPGSSIMCYNCSKVQTGSATTSTFTGGVNVAGCSNIGADTDIPLVECPNDHDVCVYLYATAVKEIKDDTTSKILGQETYEIEVRDCINVPAPEVGCFEGLSDPESKPLLKKVLDVEEFENGKTCFCKESACDANVCQGIEVLDVCIAYWLLGLAIGVVVVLSFLLGCCCCLCCKKKKEGLLKGGPAAAGYTNQVNDADVTPGIVADPGAKPAAAEPAAAPAEAPAAESSTAHGSRPATPGGTAPQSDTAF